MLIDVVEQATGEAGEPTPRRFRLGGRLIEAEAILDRWPGQGYAYVKLQGSDGATYILRHEEGSRRWHLALRERPRPAKVRGIPRP